MLAPLETAGLLKLINGSINLTKQVMTLPFEGHTPGHQCIWIMGDGPNETTGAIFIGDALHHIF
jgi:glyoxylase-like metal-dependent hydrolase (beta-lactamase superfamily II)